jgi:G protein-coupled receptor Mth (Methuselah protein)
MSTMMKCLDSVGLTLVFVCFCLIISGDMEIFAYFFGPIGILLCVNVLLFLSTARQLTCGLWKRDDVKSTTER